MEQHIKEITKRVCARDMGSTRHPMARNTMGSGWMVRSMGRDFTIRVMENPGKEYGKMERE